MTCFHCHKKIENELDMVLLDCDGDFVCNAECARLYEKEKERFLNEIVHDEKKCVAWLKGEI